MTLRAIDLCGVDYYIQTHDVELLQKLAQTLLPRPVAVNIGAAFGTSALALLEARPDLTVISIDVQPCPEEFANIKEAGFANQGRYIRILGYSHEVARAWRFGYVDLVFVDGGHNYQDCYGDMALWFEHLRPGGILAVHDYEADMLPLIKRAVDDFVQTAADLKFEERVGKLIAYRRTA
jgi:predicted O-methyltransferase YrrM